VKAIRLTRLQHVVIDVPGTVGVHRGLDAGATLEVSRQEMTEEMFGGTMEAPRRKVAEQMKLLLIWGY
jgi:hypothetical protein